MKISELSGLNRRSFLKFKALAFSHVLLFGATSLASAECKSQFFRYTCRFNHYTSFSEHEKNRAQWENLDYLNKINAEYMARGWLLKRDRHNRELADGVEITWTYEFVDASAARRWEQEIGKNAQSIWPKWGQASGYEFEIFRTYSIS